MQVGSGGTDLFGSLEAVRHRTVYGWAHTLRTAQSPKVRIEINGRNAGIASADRPRRDPPDQGIPTDRGFVWSIPESYSSIDSVRAFSIDGRSELTVPPGVICEKTNRPLPSEWRCRGRYALPSFFILGAAKCGTTSLHGHLAQHPELCMSEPKEPLYFEFEHGLGPSYYFNRYFSHWSGEKVVGEARHRNAYFSYVPARIYYYNPTAKLVVLLRNPTERAVSHWWHWYSRGEEPLSLENSIEEDRRRIQSQVAGSRPAGFSRQALSLFPNRRGFVRTYIDTGYYYDQLLRYLSLFPSEQLRIVLFEDFARDPAGVTAGVLDFIGLDRGYAGRIDYTPLNRSSSGMSAHLDGNSLDWLVEHFRPHNERLSRLIGRNLRHWDGPFEKPREASTSAAPFR